MGKNTPSRGTGDLNDAYGKIHREERAKKIEEVRKKEGEAQCEITGDNKNLTAHHSVPRLFNGPDMSTNYQLLSGNFHQNVLHATCNVTDKEKVQQRIVLTRQLMKYILDEEKSEHIKEQIDFIDDHLIEEYIYNMMNKMQHHYRERLIHLTLINSFKTIRDLNIENVRLRKQLEAIEITDTTS